MTGLEKILKAIEDEAASNAQVILKQADKEAEDILQAARLEAEKKCTEIAAKSEAEVKDILSRAESAAALLRKKSVLDSKQRMISDVIESAENTLVKLDDAGYTEFILRMVEKYAHNKPGKLLFAASDRNRFPADFEAVLNKALTEKPGATLQISDKATKIDGGFILEYGDIEENCSFEALFSAAKDDLQEKVNVFLFKQEELAGER